MKEMKKLLFITLLIFGITSAVAQNPAPFPSGVRLPNATEQTSVTRIPVMDTDGNITGYINKTDLELALGNPASDGQALVSTALGVRSWVDFPNASDFVDLTTNQTIDGTKTFQDHPLIDSNGDSDGSTFSSLFFTVASGDVTSNAAPANQGGIYFNDDGAMRIQRAGQGANLGFDLSGITVTRDLVFTDADITWNGTSLLSGGGGSSLPVDDTTSLVQDPVDNTKQARLDVENVSTGTTAVITVGADTDLTTMVNTDQAQTISGQKTFTTQPIFDQIYPRINLAANATEGIQFTRDNVSNIFQFDLNDSTGDFRLFHTDDPGSSTLTFPRTGIPTISNYTLAEQQGAGTSAIVLKEYIDAENVADRTYADGQDNQKVDNTISGRTGSAANSMQLETSAEIAGNPAVGSNEVVICSDCSPAEVVTTATIAMDGWKMYNDQTTDAATITLSDADPGETLTVYIDRASDPSLAGAGLTFNNLPNTDAFSANTEMAIYFEVAYDGTTIDYFYFER